MNPQVSDVIQCVVPIFNFVVLVILLIQSRRWTTPSLSLRIEAVEAETHNVRANLARVERDTVAWRRQSADANSEILRELASIRELMTEEAGLRVQVLEMKDRIAELEQTIRGLEVSLREEKLHGEHR